MTPADHIWWNRYDRYLVSEGWALSREAAFRRDGYRCRRCGHTGNPLQADHLTYDNYNRTGRTPVSDLRTLCRHCHKILIGRKFHRTFGQVLGRIWRRFTLKEKLLLAFVTWLALASIRDALAPTAELRPISVVTDVTPGEDNTLTNPQGLHRAPPRSSGSAVVVAPSISVLN
jgi:hypothetical protein